MSEYGREWQRAADMGPEARLRFENRTLRESLDRLKAMLEFIRRSPGGKELVEAAEITYPYE